MPGYAKLFKASGEIIDVKPANGRDFSLKEMQDFVGGHIEIVPAAHEDRILVCHDEGRLLGFPVNEKATRLYVPIGDMASIPYPIVGDVLVCDRTFVD
jgi:hypothetical protein